MGASRACGRPAQLRGAVLRNPDRDPVERLIANARTGKKMLMLFVRSRQIYSAKLYIAPYDLSGGSWRPLPIMLLATD